MASARSFTRSCTVDGAAIAPCATPGLAGSSAPSGGPDGGCAAGDAP